jgi:Domain of unknown function (DUF397)
MTEWIKPRSCDAGHCLEASQDQGGVIWLRNSQRLDLAPLDFDYPGWASFIAIIKMDSPPWWPQYITEIMPSAEDCVNFALAVRAGEFDFDAFVKIEDH